MPKAGNKLPGMPKAGIHKVIADACREQRARVRREKVLRHVQPGTKYTGHLTRNQELGTGGPLRLRLGLRSPGGPLRLTH